MSPSINWYEPADDLDFVDDDPDQPAEILTVARSGGWWSAGLRDEED